MSQPSQNGAPILLTDSRLGQCSAFASLELTLTGKVTLAESNSLLDTKLIRLLFHQLQATTQAFTVSHLNGQARAGVEFKQHGTMGAVDHHVGPQVAKPGHFIAARRQFKQTVPV